MISTLRKEITKWRKNIMAKETKPKYYEDMTKSEMVKIISKSTGIKPMTDTV